MKRAAPGALLLLSTGCWARYPVFDTASPEAHRIANLHWLMLAICVAVGVVVLGLLGVGLVRRDGGRDPGSDPRRVRAVAAGTAISALLLLVLLVASVRAGREIVTPGGPRALEIRITGHQWWWEIAYPGSGPSEEVVTANEIHVPIDRPLRFLLSSGDVIHSFWVPRLNGKKDLIPGRLTRHIFRVERPGMFRGQCAEFCGYQHAHMGFLVVAEEPARFDAWLAGERRLAAEPADPSAVHGRTVFLSSPCILCHTIRGIGAFGHKAPDLTHVASRTMIAAATLHNTPGNLAGWILDAPRIKPGTRMPPNTLASNDLLDLVAYLESLR